MNLSSELVPDWRWGTAEGSREFDRLCDRRLSFLEKVRWLEEAESLTLAMRPRPAGATAASQPKPAP